MSVPNFISSNGNHLSWNRMLLGKIFFYFHKEKFVCPATIHLPEALWYATGFYHSNYFKMVNDYTLREAGVKQHWLNLYVYTCDSADELRLTICHYERTGDQYLLLCLDKTKKFLSNFSLCEHNEHQSILVNPLMDRYCSY